MTEQITNRLRERRLGAGMSQARLAARAEVSRALVASIEQGRHSPAVSAALRLAEALGTTVEELFGAPETTPVTPVLEAGLPPGARVRAARVGRHTVVAPVAPSPGSWGAADGTLAAGTLRRFPGAAAAALVVAGCEPALGIAEALLGAGRLMAVQATTGAALGALAAGRCHAAVVHGPPAGLPDPPRMVRRRHLARWRVGLATHPALARPSVEALAGGEVRVLRREASAGSEQAFVRAVRRLGYDAPRPGPLATGHVEGAQRARWERCAAVTIEPAAAAFGLDFQPLETHAVELWVGPQGLVHPAAAALAELLVSAAFVRRLEALEGYDLEGCGTERDAA
jgi:DNA-binding XRE family transcriptional regulator